MIITYLGTTKAFVSIEDGEEYPETIKVNVDRVRIFKKHICKQCLKTYYSRDGVGEEYCCSTCYNNSRREIFVCSTCNKVFSRRKSGKHCSKHNIYFCSRKCKDFGQSLEGGIKKIQPSHYGNFDGTSLSFAPVRAKRYQRRKYGYIFCEICGERDELCLIVHHKDKNRENNKIDNLQVLCGSCHIKHHRTGL